MHPSARTSIRFMGLSNTGGRSGKSRTLLLSSSTCSLLIPRLQQSHSHKRVPASPRLGIVAGGERIESGTEWWLEATTPRGDHQGSLKRHHPKKSLSNAGGVGEGRRWGELAECPQMALVR